MDLPPDTRYIDRRGKSFAYQAFGTGPRAVVCFLEIPHHLDLLWTDPYWTDACDRLGEHCRVMLFQQLGLGLSDPVDRVPTLEQQASDIGAVLDAEGVSSATLFAVWSTSMPAVLFAASAPERVDGLVLWAPFAQGYHHEGFHSVAGFTPEQAEGMAAQFDHAFANWGVGLTLEWWDAVIAPANRRVFAMLERSAAGPSAAAAVYEAASHSDVREVLPLVRAPTRVLRHPSHGAPESVPRTVAALIPGASFHELPPSEAHMSVGASFRPAFEHLHEMISGAHRAKARGDRQLASILFTDIVGSTERVRTLGDGPWSQLLARHEGELRRCVEASGGRLVKMIGDGSMSVFSGPAAAIRAATEICESTAEIDLQVRAGVHTGECERRAGGDIAGLAVHIAARVSATAAAGEVWVSRTVKDLIGGSGIGLRSRGTHALKGVDEQWELYSVADDDLAMSRVPHEVAPTTRADRLVLLTARRAPRLLREVNRLVERRSAVRG